MTESWSSIELLKAGVPKFLVDEVYSALGRVGLKLRAGWVELSAACGGWVLQGAGQGSSRLGRVFLGTGQGRF